MAIKLHECSLTWFKANTHPCAVVAKALDEMKIPYEVVKHPVLPRSRRKLAQELTGQHRLPFIQFEDGSVLREESKDLAARIRAGKLLEGR